MIQNYWSIISERFLSVNCFILGGKFLQRHQWSIAKHLTHSKTDEKGFNISLFAVKLGSKVHISSLY